jgi:C-terminal processing protease CtpA/Prc
VPLHRLAPRSTLASLCAAALAGCAGLVGLSDDESTRVDTFDFYWQKLADDYPLFGGQPIDWNELRRRYRAAVPFAQRPHEFYHLLTGMLSELGDLHVSLRVPRERFTQDGIAATSLLDVPGLRVMPIEGRLHVVGWPRDQAPTPPDQLPPGVHHPEVVRVHGFPVVLSLVGNLLLGPPASPVELQLRWRDGVITRHVMRRPAAGTPATSSVLAHFDDGGASWRQRERDGLPWLELSRFDDERTMREIAAAIDTHRGASGLVLDLRRNLGGRYVLAKTLVERFLREPVQLVIVPRHTITGLLGLVQIEVFVGDRWLPSEPVVEAPLVVLTSALTGSAAEHTARILQRYAGATVIGERTAGVEAAIQEERGPDGSQLQFGATRIVDPTGVGLQREGVVPDVSVRLTLADVERLGAAAAVEDWESRLTAAARAALAQVR